MEAFHRHTTWRDVRTKRRRVGALQRALPKDWNVLELLAEDDLGIASHPLIQGGRIHLPEVRGERDVSVLQIRQVRYWAVHPALDGLADQEQGGCGAVVGALPPVLRDPPAEFGEGEHDDLVGAPDRIHFGLERANRV